ncbi:alpha/beta hydrolase [Streptomyces sp. NPDC051572]|uniref:alpha/beta fold hydrolase n=1 Tax=unclassified Streptomyces TaxID=2593676 RepID=UPI00344D78F6
MTCTHIELPGSGVRLAADVWTSRGRRSPHRGLVVLLHGGGQTRHSWHRTGERLAGAGWAAVTVDLRGHGDSQWAPDGDYGVSANLADIRNLVAELRRNRGGLPVALVGASLGGKAALLALGEDPGLAQALVMVDIALTVETKGGERVKQFMRSAPDGFGSLREAADAIAAYNPHRKQPGSLEGLKKNLRERDGRWYWHWDPAMMAPHPGAADSAVIHRRSRHAARRLTCPVLLVRGRESDVVSDAGVTEMRELIPDLTVTDVRDVGHMVAGDDNDVFSERLLGFLGRAISSAAAEEVG